MAPKLVNYVHYLINSEELETVEMADNPPIEGNEQTIGVNEYTDEEDWDSWNADNPATDVPVPPSEPENYWDVNMENSPLGNQTIGAIHNHNPLAMGRIYRGRVFPNIHVGGCFQALNFWFDLDTVIKKEVELGYLNYNHIDSHSERLKNLGYLDLAPGNLVEERKLQEKYHDAAFDSLCELEAIS